MSKQKRALVITDADSVWTIRHLQHVVLAEGYEVVLFPIWGNEHTRDAFYRDHHITVYEDRHRLPLVRYIPKLRMWVRIALNARQLIKLGPFDVVHNDYLSRRDLALGARVAKKFDAKWICDFWGSDLLRATKRGLKQMSPYLKKCNVISVHTQIQYDRLQAFCGEELTKKTKILFWGQEMFDHIDRIKAANSKADCKQHFGIDPSSFVVCIGYNASSAQQQLDVLEQIATIPHDGLSKITIVLQLTYCEDDPSYTKQICELAASLPCRLVVLTEFMDAEESAFLRLAADVFILAITTDAFSASMQEYLYAGACMLKGAWLQYPQLDSMGIAVAVFDAFAQVPLLLSKAMNGEISGLTDAERMLLSKRYSWDAVRSDWHSLYE